MQAIPKMRSVTDWPSRQPWMPRNGEKMRDTRCSNDGVEGSMNVGCERLAVSALRSLETNLVWYLESEAGLVLFDPGSIDPLERRWGFGMADRVQAIFLTHWHADHCEAVPILMNRNPRIQLYGPQESLRWSAMLQVLQGGESIPLFDHVEYAIQVLATPGHTAGHLAYRSSTHLWTGDTWFIGGCGRAFEASPACLWQSLSLLAALEPSLLVSPGHDYYRDNLRFLSSLQATPTCVVGKAVWVRTIREERSTNPFLLVDDEGFAKRIGYTGQLGLPFFQWLRNKKDDFC
eukprot:Blabericola_migrator_1__9258@NODE_4977_length_916_cov_3_787986_g3128_i0_p1_GENE_NODE_4977_length_916_cov_3_787986_g3128_i0NODE_4977_length_916_cov_3_787986_g3128_i0_p1_ORF_typecomplete_len290_score13_39Lactamase_B/PF00753_27/4_6e20Lactamase_B_2/PF12706_7/4_8e09Lactamase_B_3/PF13483_6/4_3e06HAGH_C/PF16123_5/1_1e05Lactamase_B_6/PF16661_5/0_00027Lactamase_B_5/PF14597_6/0_00062_NODE_4977_length_916_cov_3_787986_g3128_i034903